MDIGQLNRLMSQAEGQADIEAGELEPGASDAVPWDAFLAEVIADDFALRRSAASKPLEDRQSFLKSTRNAAPVARKEVPDSVRVWESGTLATVVSDIKLEGRPELFTNVRVFSAGGKYGWRCHWWQVTAAEA